MSEESNKAQEFSSTAVSLPQKTSQLIRVASETIRTQPYKPSGICPPVAILRMIGIGIPVGMLIGGITYLIGLLTPYIGNLLFWLIATSTNAGRGIIAFGFTIISFLAGVILLVGFPAIMGLFIGLSTAIQSKNGKCRNPKVEGAIAILNAIAGYATFNFIAFQLTGTIQLTSRLFGPTFERTVWPWWLFLLIALDLILVGGLAILSAEQANRPFCETCKQWYDHSWTRSLYLDSAEVLIQFLGTAHPSELEKIQITSPSKYPLIKLEAQKCPSCETNDVLMTAQVVNEQTTIDREGKQQTRIQYTTIFVRMIQATHAQQLHEYLTAKKNVVTGFKWPD